MLVPHPDGHQHGGQKPTETSVTGFCSKSVNLSLEELKNELGDPHLLLSKCNNHDKMQLFAKLKKFCEGGSEPP